VNPHGATNVLTSIDMNAVGVASAAPLALLAQHPAPWHWMVKVRRLTS
jgi:hypothetical protein